MCVHVCTCVYMCVHTCTHMYTVLHAHVLTSVHVSTVYMHIHNFMTQELKMQLKIIDWSSYKLPNNCWKFDQFYLMNKGGGEKLMTSFHWKLTALSNDINISHFYKLKNIGKNLIKHQVYSLGVWSRFCHFCYMLKILNALYQQSYNLELNRWYKRTWSSMYSYRDKLVCLKAVQGLLQRDISPC